MALTKEGDRLPDFHLTADQREAEYPRFERWWKDHGQFCRAGGGQYEKSFAWASWQYLLARVYQHDPRLEAELNKGTA